MLLPCSAFFYSSKKIFVSDKPTIWRRNQSGILTFLNGGRWKCPCLELMDFIPCSHLREFRQSFDSSYELIFCSMYFKIYHTLYSLHSLYCIKNAALMLCNYIFLKCYIFDSNTKRLYIWNLEQNCNYTSSVIFYLVAL